MSDKENRYATLDGIRGMAALFVVTLHAKQMFPWAHFEHAYLAVDLFFMISGVVLARAYENRLASKKIGPAAFMRLRFARVFPLYIIGVLLGACVNYLSQFFGPCTANTLPQSILASLVFAVAMMPSPFARGLFPINGPVWSLFFELIANFLYARFLPFLTGRVLASVIGGGFLAISAASIQYHMIDAGYLWRNCPFGLVRVCFSFAIGVAVHRHAAKRRIQSNAVSLAVIVVCALSLAINVPKDWETVYVIAVVSAVFPAIIIVAAQVEPSHLLRKVCLAAGTASYGIYVLHSPLASLTRFAAKGFFNIGPVVTAYWGLPFLVALAGVVFVLDRTYDPCFRRILTRTIRRGPHAAPASSIVPESPV